MKSIVGLSVCSAEPRLEPGQALLAQLAVPLPSTSVSSAIRRTGRSSTAYCRKPDAGKIALVGEGRAQRLARIVVAGNDIDRHRQAARAAGAGGRIPRACRLDQVAGHDHDVGPRVELQDMRHRALEVARGVDAVVEQLAPGRLSACRKAAR